MSDLLLHHISLKLHLPSLLLVCCLRRDDLLLHHISLKLHLPSLLSCVLPEKRSSFDFIQGFISLMDQLPELSLAPSICNNSSPESSDTGSSRKRKALSEGFLENKAVRAHRSTIDLQHSNERLPMDWEQCLDLQSGKMYFLNRKTLKKSWDRPSTKDHHKLDLELNISSPKEGPVKNNSPNSYLKSFELVRVAQAIQSTRKEDHLSSLASYCCNKEFINSSNNMVAMACMSCHLLVIVSKSNPTCPNCKYVHCIPPDRQISPPPSNPTFKPLDTLSLFS